MSLQVSREVPSLTYQSLKQVANLLLLPRPDDNDNSLKAKAIKTTQDMAKQLPEDLQNKLIDFLFQSNEDEVLKNPHIVSNVCYNDKPTIHLNDLGRFEHASRIVKIFVESFPCLKEMTVNQASSGSFSLISTENESNPLVTSVRLKDVESVSAQEILNLIQRFPKLEELILENLIIIDIPSVSNEQTHRILQKIIIKNCKLANARSIENLQRIAPNLQYLELVDVNLTSFHSLFLLSLKTLIIKSCGLLKEEIQSTQKHFPLLEALSIDFNMNSLKGIPSSVKLLELISCSVTPSAIYEIPELFPKLESFTYIFKETEELPFAPRGPHFECIGRLNNLHTLRLQNCILEGRSVDQLASIAPQLEVLDLKKSSITNATFGFPKVQKLNIAGTADYLRNPELLIKTIQLTPHLKELVFSSLDKNVSAVLSTLKCLEKIEIVDQSFNLRLTHNEIKEALLPISAKICKLDLSNLKIQDFNSIELPKLQEVIIYNCENLMQEGLQQLSINAPLLQKMQLQLAGSNIQSLEGVNFSQVKELKIGEDSSLWEPSDVHWNSILPILPAAFPDVEILEICVPQLSPFSSVFTSVKSLDIAYEGSDEGVITSVAKAFPNLKKLELAEYQLTNELAAISLPQVQELVITSLEVQIEPNFGVIATAFPNLRRLFFTDFLPISSLSFCEKLQDLVLIDIGKYCIITDEVIADLKKKLPRLTIRKKE